MILTNCKNKIAFRLGRQDASEFKEEFEPLGFSDLANCPDYHFYGKILLPDGNVSNLFFGEAPSMAIKLRNYDDFVKKHQSGKFTVDEIENELEERITAAAVMKQLMSF